MRGDIVNDRQIIIGFLLRYLLAVTVIIVVVGLIVLLLGINVGVGSCSRSAWDACGFGDGS
jgi:hypothetical protein